MQSRSTSRTCTRTRRLASSPFPRTHINADLTCTGLYVSMASHAAVRVQLGTCTPFDLAPSLSISVCLVHACKWSLQRWCMRAIYTYYVHGPGVHTLLFSMVLLSSMENEQEGPFCGSSTQKDSSRCRHVQRERTTRGEQPVHTSRSPS